MRQGCQRGFTLAETVVVVIVVSVMVSAAIPRFDKYVENQIAEEGKNILRVFLIHDMDHKQQYGSFIDPADPTNYSYTSKNFAAIDVVNNPVAGAGGIPSLLRSHNDINKRYTLYIDINSNFYCNSATVGVCDGKGITIGALSDVADWGFN